jgi:sulfur carrier protein
MEVVVNGEKQNYSEDKVSILNLLQQNEVDKPELVTVQLNEEFVDKETYESVFVAHQDQVEFLYFMAGGSR